MKTAKQQTRGEEDEELVQAEPGLLEILNNAYRSKGFIFQELTELSVYILTFRQFPFIEKQEEFELLWAGYQHGPTEAERRRARDQIVYGYRKFVASIVRKYIGRGVPVLDLMQECMETIITNVLPKYDPSHGYFTTYATWWVRKTCNRAIQEMNSRIPYHIPVHLQETMGVVRRTITKLEAKNEGRRPTNLEIFKELKTKGDQRSQNLGLAEIQQARELLETMHSSLDNVVSVGDEGEESTLGDFVSFEVMDPIKAKWIERSLDHETRMDAVLLQTENDGVLRGVEEALSSMPERVAQVLRLRLGLGDFFPMTLEEIGERYELTRERVRQLEAKGVEFLKKAGIELSAAQLWELCEIQRNLAELIEG